MVDLLHIIDPLTSPFHCRDCGVFIPKDVAILGDDVVELGGAGVHWLPRFAFEGKSHSCQKAKGATGIVVCIACEGAGCEECGNNGLIGSDGTLLTTGAAKPQGGEVVEVAPARTEFEKQIARAGLQNFVNMREATKPDGIEG